MTSLKLRTIVCTISIFLNFILLSIVCFAHRDKLFNLLGFHFSTVMFGDSITNACNWAGMLNTSTIKTSGNPGFNTANLAYVLPDQTIRYRPTQVYLMAGVNDQLQGIPVDRTISNYRNMVDTLIAHKIEPIVQSTLYVNRPDDSTINNNIHVLNDSLRAICYSRHIRYIDLNRIFSKNYRLLSQYTVDGVHLTGDAYRKWASIIAL